LSQQAGAPIGEMVDGAQPADSCGRPGSCDDGAYAALIEHVGDLSVRIGVDQFVDFLDNLCIGGAQFHARLG
jgi:hypothetical protein